LQTIDIFVEFALVVYYMSIR